MTRLDRDQVINELRAMADCIEADPDLDIPNQWGRYGGFQWYVFSDTNPIEAQAGIAHDLMRRLPPTKWEKDTNPTDLYDIRSGDGPVRVEITVKRDAVCRRVVTGTREVTEEVPDPAAVEALPKVTVTRTEEITAWECHPILAAATEGVAS